MYVQSNFNSLDKLYKLKYFGTMSSIPNIFL